MDGFKGRVDVESATKTADFILAVHDDNGPMAMRLLRELMEMPSTGVVGLTVELARFVNMLGTNQHGDRWPEIMRTAVLAMEIDAIVSDTEDGAAPSD